MLWDPVGVCVCRQFRNVDQIFTEKMIFYEESDIWRIEYVPSQTEFALVREIPDQCEFPLSGLIVIVHKL